MSRSLRLIAVLLCLGLAVALSACAERRITTSVQDQAFVPTPPPIAKAEPPARAPEEVRVPEPPAPPIAAAPRPEPPAAPAPEARLEQPPAAAPAPAPAPPPAALTDVFFDFDRFTLRNDGQATLDADYRVIKGASGHKLVIEGHCDERGTVEYNLVLGERRAHAVERYLENLGVPASEIQVVSYGKERPFCTDHNNDCWQKNRRAHLVLQ
jgi:peptidoglycan-associated lipoprotein